MGIGDYEREQFGRENENLTLQQMRERTAARENLPENQVGHVVQKGSEEYKLIQEELNMKGTRKNPL
jgi:hypothetical protein